MQDLALLANSSTGNTESGKFWHFSLAILVRLTGQECSKPGNKNQSSHRAGLVAWDMTIAQEGKQVNKSICVSSDTAQHAGEPQPPESGQIASTPLKP